MADEGKKPETMGRRKALGILGSLALTSFTGLSIYRNLKSDKWDFIYTDPLNQTTKIDLDYVTSCVPLGPIFELAEANRMRRSMMKRMTPKFLEGIVRGAGFKFPDYYDFSIKGRYYGTPEERGMGENLEVYCKKAEYFLNSQISGLRDVNVEWNKIGAGEDHTEDANGNMFIGNCSYFLGILGIKNRHKPAQQKDVPVFINNLSGAWLAPPSRNPERFGEWYGFISSGEDALVAPFGELIPLTTIDPSIELAEKDGKFDAEVGNETISEALSAILAMRLSDELSIPNGRRVILNHSLDLPSRDPVYVHVPKAIRWIQEKEKTLGVRAPQEAFDIYMDNPAKFLEVIEA